MQLNCRKRNANLVNLNIGLTITNWHNWKICENSEHMVSFRCLALVCVIWPLEKSNTSSLRSLRIAMLFWQRLSLVLLAPTMSGINDSQFLGHSRFNTWWQKTELRSSFQNTNICHVHQEPTWPKSLKGLQIFSSILPPANLLENSSSWEADR